MVDSDETAFLGTAILDAAILAVVPARARFGGARVDVGCGGATGGVDYRRDFDLWHLELIDG